MPDSLEKVFQIMSSILALIFAQYLNAILSLNSAMNSGNKSTYILELVSEANTVFTCERNLAQSL